MTRAPARRSARDQARVARWLPAYAMLAGIWGFSFLFIKIADRALAPLQVAFGRVLLGAVVVTAITLARRERLPAAGGTWLCLAMAALLMNVAPFTLLAFGEQRISSVDAGLLNATTPLLTVPATIWLIPAERPGRRGIAGLLVGFAGVVILLGATPHLGGRTAAGDAFCLGAACCYGIGFPYSRRYLSDTGLAPVALAAGQLACASAELAVIALPVTPLPTVTSLGPILSLVALGAAGTGLAYILNFTVVAEAGATVAATVTYVVPACSTGAGMLLLGEPLTAGAVIGAAVIVTGAALTRRAA
jgi:drug/metabolite transporter (DMT)-like permease